MRNKCEPYGRQSGPRTRSARVIAPTIGARPVHRFRVWARVCLFCGEGRPHLRGAGAGGAPLGSPPSCRDLCLRGDPRCRFLLLLIGGETRQRDYSLNIGRSCRVRLCLLWQPTGKQNDPAAGHSINSVSRSHRAIARAERERARPLAPTRTIAHPNMDVTRTSMRVCAHSRQSAQTATNRDGKSNIMFI